METRKYTRILVGVILAAVALHLYENAMRTSGSGFTSGWFAWQMVPYVLILILSRFKALVIPVMPASFIVLAMDLITHYEVFISPSSSTAAIMLIWIPLWNTVVIVPAATFITWLVRRLVYRERRA